NARRLNARRLNARRLNARRLNARRLNARRLNARRLNALQNSRPKQSEKQSALAPEPGSLREAPSAKPSKPEPWLRLSRRRPRRPPNAKARAWPAKCKPSASAPSWRLFCTST
ncbi:hypothetical protein, partial [Roseateles oligotrophus]|uniref:hypothetical protein n=1 Tax=Roseateles oligotrophus TaxID=1769250 RepID=UPI001C867295